MCSANSLTLLVAAAISATTHGSPLKPFAPDAHTLLLYHFDEGEGALAKDASKHGYHGEVRGAKWTDGKFGKALRFNGKDACVFRKMTEAIRDLKQITVECWFNQDDPSGRQFLVGKDVAFHFDVSGGHSTSMSIYNRGGRAPNADGLRHQQLGARISVPARRWHHNAVTYDGAHVSFFFDGKLVQRVEAAKDFRLGVQSRGLWVGCYVGMDFWFSGKIDEVRVSDSVRYDPEKRLKVGARIFEMAQKPRRVLAVRKAKRTGTARLQLTLKKLYGGNAAGWVYLKPPSKRAAIVGRYDLKGTTDGQVAELECDVSDEVEGNGSYLVGLVATQNAGYFALTRATLSGAGRTLAQWSGSVRSRRTFSPPVLAALHVGDAPAKASSRIVLLPRGADRMWGDLEVYEEDGEAPCLSGNGYAECWLDVPAAASYRVHMRYASKSRRPCDIVIDGRDLNAYNMCALNPTGGYRSSDAFWEYQGTARLAAGAHWLRIQGMPPGIVALRLEPEPAFESPATPWQRHPVPPGDFLCRAELWVASTQFGKPIETRMALTAPGTLRYATHFTNTDENRLFAGDGARLTFAGAFDLEPFGRLTFRWQGQGSGHVLALRAIDVKGIEKLLWRERDTSAEPREIRVPISFEGNNVFDPTRVVSICFDLDEGNVNPGQPSRFEGSIINPVFERRDVIVPAADYAGMLAQARTAMAEIATPAGKRGATLTSPGFKPWTRPVVPEEHPLYATADPKPVTRQTMGYDLHFTGARNISEATLDDFHQHYDFGDVCWPHIGICPQRSRYKTAAGYQRALKGLEERLRDVRRRGLYLFDIWGYVPFNPRYRHKIAPEHHEILRRVLGDRFLGYDNGEQDGRYIGSYAHKSKAANRKEAWLDFVKWDEHICGDSMDYMNATGSLNFSHYYGERNCRTLGLETAQGLPSDTLMFAFLRGASKQYGRLTTQATSIWNRYGYRMYHGRKTIRAGGYGYGPNKGCSLSLHKRLFFSGYLGGQSIVGTETSQFTADRLPNGARELSPLGRQHLEIKEWVEKHPDRGVMYTPIAFMLDFYNGWNMPRHLYRRDKYRIWGKFPYEKGDYLIDAVFRMVWPGYQDCSYRRNERGFITATPYGDIFDVITNRCQPEIMKQYTAIMLLGDVEMTPEVVAKLADFVRAGGDLLVDAKRAEALPGELAGLRLGEQAKGCMSRVLSTARTFEELPYTYRVARLTTARSLLVNERGDPLISVQAAGKGRVIVAAIDRWLTDEVRYRAPKIVNMEPPYLLPKGVMRVLGRYFASFAPVVVEPPGLNVRVNCFEGDPRRLLVGLMNNDLFADWRGTLRVRRGEVASATELRTGDTLKPARGIALKVRAGDVAMVDVRLR